MFEAVFTTLMILFDTDIGIDPGNGLKANVRYTGIPKSVKESVHKQAEKGKVVLTEQSTEIFENVFVTGQVPRTVDYEEVEGSFFLDRDCKSRDSMADDQSMFFNTSKGIVVILGCAHSGVTNTLNHISNLSGQNQIYGVIGGMHLLNASADRISRTVETLKRYEVEKVAAMHCTGKMASAEISRVFRVAVSKVRIPRSQRITRRFPSERIYSALIKNS